MFLAGPSRSGTGMVRTILNLGGVVRLAGETHYFDDLRPRLTDPTALLAGPELQRTRSYFLALSHRRYGFQGSEEQASIPPEQLDALAASLGGSADAYFQAFCRLIADRNNDPDGAWRTTTDLDSIGPSRWGEKTPRHVFRIGDILAAYPEAQVACMVRDPRAVVASYAQWRTTKATAGIDAEPEQAEAVEEESRRVRRSFHPVTASLMVRGAITAAEAALREYGPERVRLIRYETLVDDPLAVVPDLCAWLGVEFSDTMLETPYHSSSFEQYQAGAGIQQRSRDRWRTTLEPAEISTVQLVCSGLMKRWGYPPIDTGAPPWGVAAEFATWPFVAARAVIANRERIASIPDYLLRRILPGRRT